MTEEQIDELLKTQQRIALANEHQLEANKELKEIKMILKEVLAAHKLYIQAGVKIKEKENPSEKKG